MVYLKEYSDRLRAQLVEDENLPLVAYFYITQSPGLNALTINLSGDEEIAAQGYMGEIVEESLVNTIISRKPVKGFH